MNKKQLIVGGIVMLLGLVALVVIPVGAISLYTNATRPLIIGADSDIQVFRGWSFVRSEITDEVDICALREVLAQTTVGRRSRCESENSSLWSIDFRENGRNVHIRLRETDRVYIGDYPRFTITCACAIRGILEGED
ncbi:MAG: hypothetical protein LBE35_04135 [Clostridiales bacterium]|jgi:hypothetical protein|nr:hypothetical protein [Clostridiales bacterium]